MDLLITAVLLAAIGVVSYVSYRVAEAKTAQRYAIEIAGSRARERRHLDTIRRLDHDVNDLRTQVRRLKAVR